MNEQWASNWKRLINWNHPTTNEMICLHENTLRTYLFHAIRWAHVWRVSHESSIFRIQYLGWSVCIVELPCTISRRLACRTTLGCSTCHVLFLSTTSSSWLCRHHLLPSSSGSFVAAWPTFLYPSWVPTNGTKKSQWRMFEVMIILRWNKHRIILHLIVTLSKFKWHCMIYNAFGLNWNVNIVDGSEFRFE